MSTPTPVHVLLVEDDEDDYFIIKECLSDSFTPYEITWSRNEAQFLEQLGKHTFDIVLTDYLLGSTSGLEVLKHVKEKDPLIPVILLTGKGNSAIDMEAMKLGASDYLVKGSFDSTQLERSVRYALERSVTARVLRENENYKSQLNKIISTDRIIRMLAHEIRNPLTNIMLSAEQIKHILGDGSEAEFFLDIISKGSDKIRQLVNDLIDSTKFGDVKMKRQNLVEVVQDALLLATDRAKLKAVKVLEKYSHNAIDMDLDEGKMKIALLNIVINAIEAVEEQSGVVHVEVTKKRDQVYVRVKDNGCGMSEENLQNLFVPFYTSKPNGAGLGLTSTQNIVVGHKGRIEVKSEKGKGSEFTLTFPLMQDAPVVQETSRSAS